MTGPQVESHPGGGANLIQAVYTQTGAVLTGTTLIPVDDTIPQNTEGDEYMTLAITPTNASNKLVIEAVAQVSHTDTTPGVVIMALFQDTTVNALAVVAESDSSKLSDRDAIQLVLRHEMTAGTISATTFKIRIGSRDTGTLTFNGDAGLRLFGGVYASHIRIQEVAP